MLLVIACLCYEPRERSRFYKVYPSEFSKRLASIVYSSKFLAKEKRFRHIEKLTSLVHPCYHGQSIFEILKNTNLLEGDLIRFFKQILDRIGQIRSATRDSRMIDMLENIHDTVTESLKDIDII